MLSRWGDVGWGAMFAEDKRAGRFRDDLVTALAEMIQERWRPEPSPTWVTCVPSLRRPTLVAELAQRLAAKLHLPFVAVVDKVKDSGPQKLQQNGYHQCRNLDGVFQVRKEAVGAGPVLLLDDVVDSAWTMTIVSALLLQAGSGPVWPVALATTRSGD